MASSKRKTASKAGPVSTRANAKAATTMSKQQRMIDLLRRPEGATIAQLSKAFGWQPHTVRGAISGALKKKLGLKIKSEKHEGRERTYRIA